MKKKSILGIIFGHGCISIVGIGWTKEHFLNLRNPIQFRLPFIENDILSIND